MATIQTKLFNLPNIFVSRGASSHNPLRSSGSLLGIGPGLPIRVQSSRFSVVDPPVGHAVLRNEIESELEMWANANLMVALPNIGGALCSTPQSLAHTLLDWHDCRACSNAAKTRKPLKFAGVPQTGKPISAASGPNFCILWGHVEDILLLNKFFSDCRYVP